MEELDILLNSLPELDTSAITRAREYSVYAAAKTGVVSQLETVLAPISAKKRPALINRVYEDEGQLCSPLIIAARKGHYDMVKRLLEEKADTEVEGTVKFDGHIIEGATALWCCAGAGYLNIVEMLVTARPTGANVNHQTKSKSTPLRAACFEGRLDIVRFLCEHGANAETANKYNNTCLMISSFKGHDKVVEYLLEQKVDPNTKASCGATALHFAAEIGHINIVKSLLKFGARMEKNEFGMTPLLSAAERCQVVMVQFLIEGGEIQISKLESIEAQELLGASFANDRDHYDPGLAYNLMMSAMKLRWEEPVMEKLNIKKMPQYEDWKECRTIAELEAISDNPDQLHMEGLCIRERILGRACPEVAYAVTYRGAVFADEGRFSSCTVLWLHSLDLRQEIGVSTWKDLLRFAQMFCQMLKFGHEVEISSVTSVLKAAVKEIERNQSELVNPGKDDVEAVQEELENNMLTSLYLIVVLTKVYKLSQTAKTNSNNNNSGELTANGVEVGSSANSKCSSRQHNRLVDDRSMQEIFKLVHLNPATSTGSSLLHLCVNQLTPVDDFHTNDVCKFPCFNTAKLLLQAGADPQVMDCRRNTPLHIIVGYKRVVADFITLHSIIMALLEYGAHIDSVNAQGQTSFDAASTGVAEIILKSQTKMSLKCLAAQSIRKYNLSYEGQVPKVLEAFIEIHGP